jgi:hypothetical protein
MVLTRLLAHDDEDRQKDDAPGHCDIQVRHPNSSFSVEILSVETAPEIRVHPPDDPQQVLGQPLFADRALRHSGFHP